MTHALPREISERARESRDALHAIYVCHRGGVLVARISVYASWPLNIARAPPTFRDDTRVSGTGGPIGVLRCERSYGS